jgi:hypothetical protein
MITTCLIFDDAGMICDGGSDKDETDELSQAVSIPSENATVSRINCITSQRFCLSSVDSALTDSQPRSSRGGALGSRRRAPVTQGE